MEVSSSQSLALAAYATQQQLPPSRPRETERDATTTEQAGNAPRTGDNVNFSREALRLSAQERQQDDQGPAATREGTRSQNNTEFLQTARPEQVRADSARTTAQAVNAYRDTSII